MTPDPRCPTPDALRELLEDRLPPAEQAALATHLEDCAACRAAMEGIAAESRLWGEVRGLAEGVGRRDDTRETHEAPPVDDGVPGFLDPPDPEQPEQIGRLGPYAVHDVIGRGGWGVVLKGFDPSLHRPIAIKVLAPQYATSATARRRFVREARAAASISHDHVVTIHAVDEWKGLPYLVMQYVAGKSLQERIDRTGPLEVKEVLRIGMQAARGLAAAHAQGLIHRDVKPANILLENGIERVKLTDFGLARAVDDASLTQSGLVAGTPQYMAPEQARGEAIDHRADLFSLGGVLYAMATGHSPFRGRSTMAVLRRVCDEAPRPVREANPEIPEELAVAIHRLLAKDPAERFASASEVADVLASQLARRQHAAPTVDVPEVGPEKSPTRAEATNRRRSRVGGAVVVAAGVLVVFLGANPFGVADQVKKLVQTVLRIQTADGTLVLDVNDPDIKVRVDGEDVVLNGAGLSEIRLRPGPHDVRAATVDGREAGMRITVERGDKQVASIRHEPTGQPALVVGERTATLLPRSKPSDTVSSVAVASLPPAPPRGGYMPDVVAATPPAGVVKVAEVPAPAAPPAPATTPELASLSRPPAAPADDPRRDATIELARSLVDQAERRLAEAEAAREQAEGDAESAKQEVTVAEKAMVAREDAYKRVSQLAAHRAIEQHLVDEVRQHYDEAVAAVRLAKNRALLGESMVPSAEARLAMARAELDIARLNLRALEDPAPGLVDRQREARARLAALEVEVALGDRSVAAKAVEVARAALERQVADRKYRETASARVRNLVSRGALEQRLADEEQARLEVATASETARNSDLKAAEARLKLAERRVADAEKRLKALQDGGAQRPEPARAAGSSSTR